MVTDIPPASLFRLVPKHIAFRVLRTLARSTDTVLDEMGRSAGTLPHPPVSAIVFGSFARPEAGADSDIDVVVVRPAGVVEDERSASLEAWRRDTQRLTGNSVEETAHPGLSDRSSVNAGGRRDRIPTRLRP